MTHISVRQAVAFDPAATAPLAKKSTDVQTQSFADELSQTFAEAQSKFGINPNDINLSVASLSNHTNVAPRQNPVAASTASVTAPIGLNALVPKTASPVPEASTTVAPPPSSAPSATDTLESEDDAYWANQPAAVQQLRNIDDPSQRAALGAQLASQGYSIDTPIMVWGWDPTLTTQLRESFGYTWVPSAMQSPVTAAPGITGAGITPYNPDDPPPGSISV